MRCLTAAQPLVSHAAQGAAAYDRATPATAAADRKFFDADLSAFADSALAKVRHVHVYIWLTSFHAVAHTGFLASPIRMCLGHSFESCQASRLWSLLPAGLLDSSPQQQASSLHCQHTYVEPFVV